MKQRINPCHSYKGADTSKNVKCEGHGRNKGTKGKYSMCKGSCSTNLALGGAANSNCVQTAKTKENK